MKRSPLFYVGDKYKILNQILLYFPSHINNFIEPFVGGGSVFLNTKAKNYYLNDLDKNIINIHKTLTNNKNTIFETLENDIYNYGFSRSYKEDIIPKELRVEFPKTYYSHFNKPYYEKLKNDFNNNKHDILKLYLLLIYGFNRTIRFNSSGNFNIPVGNVDFNKNVENALVDYVNFKGNTIFSSNDCLEFMDSIRFKQNDFVYLDPPYLITESEYNKMWNENDEVRFLNYLTKLNKSGIKFALSNVLKYKDKTNTLLQKWCNDYKIIKINSNYINYHNNKKKEIEEVLILN